MIDEDCYGEIRIFYQNDLPGGHSERAPPDPIPNSEVKPFSADDSVDLSM